MRRFLPRCHFEDNNWIAQLAYLADVFTKLNELNLWKRLCAEGDFSCFPQFDSFVVSENMERDTVKTFLDGQLVNVIYSLSCLVAL